MAFHIIPGVPYCKNLKLVCWYVECMTMCPMNYVYTEIEIEMGPINYEPVCVYRVHRNVSNEL